jgi:glutaredoxin-related protein
MNSIAEVIKRGLQLSDNRGRFEISTIRNRIGIAFYLVKGNMQINASGATVEEAFQDLNKRFEQYFPAKV